MRAPFITTPPEVVARMLQLAGTGPQDTVLDLGSGDGRIVIAAAREHGARGLGIELDPKLVAQARENARRAGVADRARFEEGDALKTDLSQASVVTIYLLPFLLDQLQPRLLAQLRPGARVVTHAFAFKGWKPDRSETVRISARHEGQGDESRIFLWVVPAQVRGGWQAAGWLALAHPPEFPGDRGRRDAGRQIPRGEHGAARGVGAFLHRAGFFLPRTGRGFPPDGRAAAGRRSARRSLSSGIARGLSPGSSGPAGRARA